MSDASIRRNPDGSIDHKFYMNRGREVRSEAAHDILGRASGAVAARSVDAERQVQKLARASFGRRLVLAWRSALS